MLSSAQPAVRWPARGRSLARLPALAVFAALLALLALNAAKFGYNAWLSAVFPWEIDYGEGIVWQQARLIPGPLMYGDLQRYPFLVFHYPPVYHLFADAAAWAGLPWLVGARAVSSLSCVAVAVFSGAFVFEAARQPGGRALPGFDPARHAPLAGALVAGLLVFSLSPLNFWGRTARVDLLASAWEMFGLYLGLLGLRRPGLLVPAFLAFVLAAFTKQTMLAGGAVTFLVALFYQRGRALYAALPALVAGAAALAVLTVVTDGGFLRHIVLYNVNRFSLADALHMFLTLGPENLPPAFLAVAAISAGAIVARGAAGGVRNLPPGSLIALLYFVLTTANLVGLGKTGASTNYFIPWACSASPLIGLAVAAGARRISASRAHLAAFLALIAVLLMQTLTLPGIGERRLVDPVLRQQSQELLAMTRAADKPVLSDDMVLLMQAGKQMPWEPAIITELSAKGLFDERKIIAMIEDHALAFAVATEIPKWFDQRYSPGVRAALAKAYPVSRTLAGHRILLPREN